MSAGPVAFLLNGDEDYGVLTSTIDFATAAARRQRLASVVTVGPGAAADRVRAAGLPVVVAADRFVPRADRGVLRSIVERRRLAAPLGRAVAVRLREVGAASVYFRVPPLLPLAGRAAAEVGVRAVWHLPNAIGDRYPFGLNQRIYRSTLDRLGVTAVANSEHTARSLREVVSEPPVVYPGIDTGRFDPARITPADRAALGIPADAIVAVVVGRLDPTKGQDRVAAALGRGPASGVHLVLAGEGSVADRARIENAARIAGAGDRVHLVGRVDEPERWYAAADIVVNARIDPEPFGRTLVEGMAVGRPVLAHAAGGPTDIVVDGATGWLVPEPTVTAWRSGLGRALADRARWAELGAAGRARARERYDLERNADRLLTILDGSRP